jgi:hypothetical protein
MASDATRIGKGTLSDSLANIDDAAVPADHIRFVKAITLCNKTATDRTVTITFAGTNVIYTYTLEGYGAGKENTITIPFFDQVMEAAERIQGSASATSAIDYYISGREIDIS